MAEWRVGGKLKRTLYRNEQLVGLVDTAEIAGEIVETMNRVGALLDEVRSAHPVRCDATAAGLLAVLGEPGHVHRCVYPARRPSTPGRFDHRCECGTEWTDIDPRDAERRSEATPQKDLSIPLLPDFAALDPSRVDPYDTTKGGITE